jgi:hypothetical protein
MRRTVMADQRGTERHGDGRDGGDGPPFFWLSSEEIERIKAREVATYQILYPKSELIDEGWNYAIFRRRFLWIVNHDQIFIFNDGFVEQRRV